MGEKRSVTIGGDTVIGALAITGPFSATVRRYVVVTVDNGGACRVARVSALADADEYEELLYSFSQHGEVANRGEAMACALREAGYADLDV